MSTNVIEQLELKAKADPKRIIFPESEEPKILQAARQALDSATNFYRLLLRARKVQGQTRADALLDADAELETLKALLRLGQERRYMSLGQYRHVSGLLINIGQQLGGWRNSTESRLAPAARS